MLGLTFSLSWFCQVADGLNPDDCLAGVAWRVALRAPLWVYNCGVICGGSCNALVRCHARLHGSALAFAVPYLSKSSLRNMVTAYGRPSFVLLLLLVLDWLKRFGFNLVICHCVHYQLLDGLQALASFCPLTSSCWLADFPQYLSAIIADALALAMAIHLLASSSQLVRLSR